ncbi:hypothetical protein GCM10010339_92060 [Streptomyces alanosinicus]|uniref:Uncharacterized protein n=1 Tax=Streptomyces alanosinicus TaxID=68171 RepID=A0A919D729_9ACTN|nr:hypothetical protein GCM10010339_92060 [Streptomyces alanosinicus]
MRSEGIAEQLRLRPTMKAEVDSGYRGLANEFPNRVSAPPEKPKELTDEDAQSLSTTAGARQNGSSPRPGSA